MTSTYMSPLAPLPGGTVVTLASDKGGVLKSETARNLACALGTLADFDWANGCITETLGYDRDLRRISPMQEALTKGTVPRPLKGFGGIPLIPSFRDLPASGFDRKDIAKAVKTWATELDTGLIIDNHPDVESEIVIGTINAADLVLIPTRLSVPDLNGVRGLLERISSQSSTAASSAPGRAAGDQIIMIVPTDVPMVYNHDAQKLYPKSLFRANLTELGKTADEFGAFVSTPLPRCEAMIGRSRRSRGSVVAMRPVPKIYGDYVFQFMLFAREVSDLVAG